MPQPWRFVVFGDTRTAGMDPPDVLFELVAAATTAQPELTLAVGDLIKAEPDPTLVAEQWRRWQAAMAPLGLSARVMPWLLVTPGNHDVEGGSWADAAMAAAFPDLPSNGPAGLERRTYRYDYRGVRFISITSERYGDPHRISDQLQWLEQQLQQNPNRYTIVFSHDSAFPVGPHVGSSLDAYPVDRDRFWALLKQYQVTAYIAGHEHLYNRQIIAGVPQLIIGVSGSFPYIGYGGDFYHYLMVEVGPDQLTGVVYDRFGIEQDRFNLPARTE
jgi:hypothetical protein